MSNKKKSNDNFKKVMAGILAGLMVFTVVAAAFLIFR